MSLILRIAKAIALGALRACSLFLALFGMYLGLTHAWPAYRALADAAAERPALEQELLRFRGELRRREARLVQLRQQLEVLAESELLALRQNKESLESALVDLDGRRQKLESDLQALAAQDAEYCTGWNPFKRWVCKEVRERVERTRAVVQPLVQELEATRSTLVGQIVTAGEALRRYEAMPMDQRVSTEGGQRIRAQLAEQVYEQGVTEQALKEVEARVARARLAEASPWVWVTGQLREVAWPLGSVVIGVLLAPWLQRTLFYFVVMPWVASARMLHLVSGQKGTLTIGPSRRTLPIELAAHERCLARADYVRPVAGRTSSQWLLSWKAPLVSYAAGLSILTRLESAEDGATVRATLASPLEAESYLVELTLAEHPGFIFHPRHLVAVIGEVELFSSWRIWSVHSWMTGQLRYIGVRGTGRCVFEGFGDVVAQSVDQHPSRIEQELVVGFDARLGYATARTETFLPYFLGRTPLVDDVFQGNGAYLWQKNASRRHRTFGQRWFELFFGAVGKLLGF